ncbi:MAG: thioether cross-link-forming SCIFF peptide maturase [Clostridiales bacterium]|nr:thioether cross-link-forming SCIFF peptide maturase [Clostridiales bacterium]
MIHLFESLNHYYVYDVYSGALHMPDEQAYRVLSLYKEHNNEDEIIKALEGEHTIHDIKQTISEIETLIDENLLYSSMDYDDIKLLQTGRIKAMCLHVAHDCNLRCKYCFASKGAFGGKRTLMSVDVGKKALDFLIRNSGDAKTLEVDFFGGEPLMNFDVVKEITYYGRELEKTHKKEFRFTLTTNAYDMDDTIIEFLNEEIYNVVISIDGREDVHDFMRPDNSGKGSQSTILKNAKKFAEKRGDKSYYIRGTYTKNNLDFAEDVKYLADQGFEQLSIEPVVADKSMSYALNNNDLDTIKKEYEKLAKWYYDYRKKKFVNFFHFMINLEEGPCLIKRLSGCGAGFEYVAVTPEGDVYPCHQYVGNEEMILATIADAHINKKMAEEFAANHVINKQQCKDCWAQFWCGGGCGANAYKFNGDISIPYAMECDMLKTRLECAMAVYALEKGDND